MNPACAVWVSSRVVPVVVERCVRGRAPLWYAAIN